MARKRSLHRIWLASIVLLTLAAWTPPVAAALGPNGLAAVPVTWVGNLTPNGLSIQNIPAAGTLSITVEVYSAGVTNLPGQGAGIICAVHYGSVSAFGGPWSAIADLPMAYAGDSGNNDRYSANLGPLAPGSYEYTAWCSGDGGLTLTWADNAGTGGNGKLVVGGTPIVPTPTPTFVPTPTSTATATPSPLPSPTVGPGVVIQSVDGLNPGGNLPQTVPTGGTLTVSVNVYAPLVTPLPGQGPGIICALEYGAVSYFGGPWSNITDVPMGYAGDNGNQDRYAAVLGPLPAGLYQYTAWCSGDGGYSRIWADTSSSGGVGMLTVYGGPWPTTTAWPIPTGWPTPEVCQSLLRNPGFEETGWWLLGPTARMPQYTTAQFHSGQRSLAMGSLVPGAGVPSYSSAQQVVAIPAGAQAVRVRFWYYPVSGDAPGGENRQELILLDPQRGDETVEVLWRVTENDRVWKMQEFDLTRYRGRRLSIYFNARNAATGSTGMYLDDADLLACQPAPMPLTALEMQTPPAQPPPMLQTAQVRAVETLAPTAQVTVVAVPTQPPSLAPSPTPLPAPRGPRVTEILRENSPIAVACLLGIIIVFSILIVTQLLARRS